MLEGITTVGSHMTENADLRQGHSRRRRRRRRLITAGVVLLVLGASVGTYLASVLLAPVHAIEAVVDAPPVGQPPAVRLLLPKAAESAAIVTGADEFAGIAAAKGMLVNTGGDQPRPIASIAKVVAALVVLDAVPLAPGEAGPTIAFTDDDVALYEKYYALGASIQHMKYGATMSLHDALETMLVVSATNYAEAVTTWAFGSPSAYRDAAQEWLTKNGLTSTTITEATGIDPADTSTPTDLIALGRLAMSNPVVAELVQTAVLKVSPLDPQQNTNSVLGVSGINGIKTGTLEEAGACLLFSAVMDVGIGHPITVIGVVLGGSDQYAVGVGVEELLESISNGFLHAPVVGAGDVFGSFTTPWGQEADIVAGKAASVLTWSDTPITSSVKIGDVAPGSPSGTRVGTATFVSETGTVEVPLVTSGPIDGPGGWWRVMHPFLVLAG